MAGRIITARHGRPNLDRTMRISARDYGDWWAQYDKSGLHEDETPPDGLVELAKGARTVLSSNLPRAIETAAQVLERAGDGRTAPADPLFVEAPLPAPPVPFLRLKPGTWGVISRAFWFWGFAPNGIENHPQSWRRVRLIVDRLAEHARDGDVLLCAHGYLNWMLDREFRRQQWWRVDRAGGNHYWSYRVYEASTAPETAERRDSNRETKDATVSV